MWRSIICQVITHYIDNRRRKWQIKFISQSTIQSSFRRHLPFYLLMALYFTMPAKSMTQTFAEDFFVRPALSLANQTWLPYHDDYLKSVNQPAIGFALSYFYQGELIKNLKIRTGLGVKKKGTRVKGLPTPISAKNYDKYKHLSLTGSCEILYHIPFEQKTSLCLIGGLGVDYLVGEKPKIKRWIPIEIETYFEHDDYKRAILNAPMGIGLTLNDAVSFEIVYALSLTPSLNVRQLLIKDRYWTLGLYIRLGAPPSARSSQQIDNQQY